MSIPRRCDLKRCTSTELSIRNVTLEVEKLPAHPLLTDAVMLLQAARDKVADWVDQQESEG